MLSASPVPAPRAMALSMVSRFILAPSALSTAARSRGLSSTTAPPARAATTSSRINLVKSLPRLASCAALRCLMFAHLLWPAILNQSAAGCSVRRGRSDSSRSCCSETSPGASVMTHWALWVLGKAMTSRIDCPPTISMTRRSRPKARPA